jgi:hypothetical protein
MIFFPEKTLIHHPTTSATRTIDARHDFDRHQASGELQWRYSDHQTR